MREFKCNHCGEIAAHTNGESLYFNGKKVPLDPLSIVFPCKKCGRCVRWNSTSNRKPLTAGR